MFSKLALGLLLIGVRLVDLVYRHHYGYAGRLDVVDGFDGLRHDPVVGRHHKYCDVGKLRSPGAHRGERLVAGRVQERDRSTVVIDLIGADSLGDAADLALGHFGVPDGIEQGRLAVIDVSEDRDDRSARLQLFLILLVGRDHQGAGLVLFFVQLLGLTAEGPRHGDSDLLIHDLVDGDHVAVAHELLDDVDGVDPHHAGEIADGQGRGDLEDAQRRGLYHRDRSLAGLPVRPGSPPRTPSWSVSSSHTLFRRRLARCLLATAFDRRFYSRQQAIPRFIVDTRPKGVLQAAPLEAIPPTRRVLAEVDAAARESGGGVHVNGAILRGHQTDQVRFRRPGPADNAGPERDSALVGLRDHDGLLPPLTGLRLAAGSTPTSTAATAAATSGLQAAELRDVLREANTAGL